jgi:hypothetical protein
VLVAFSRVAMMPTDPPPPNSSSVSPLVTSSCRSTPTAASAELGNAAASSHDTCSGLRVQIDATAYSAYPPRPNSRAVTASPADVPVNAGPGRVDRASRLEAEHGIRGQRNVFQVPGAQGQIGRADAGRPDLDPDLSFTWLGQRDRGPLQHLRRSVPGHHNRVGHGSSFLPGSGLGR